MTNLANMKIRTKIFTVLLLPLILVLIGGGILSKISGMPASWPRA